MGKCLIVISQRSVFLGTSFFSHCYSITGKITVRKMNLHSSTKSADYLILYIFEKTLWYLCKSECHKYVSLFSEICVKLFNGILIELFDRYNIVLYRIYFSGHPVYIIYRINKRRIAILCSKNRISAHIVQPIRDAWILIWQIRKNW